MNAAMPLRDATDVCRWLREIVPAAQLTIDSRRVQRGDVFLACSGESGDGRHYIPQAIEAGEIGRASCRERV